MKEQMEVFVVARFLRKNHLLIWESKLFGTEDKAKIIRVNLPEDENWKVHKCSLSFPDLKKKETK